MMPQENLPHIVLPEPPERLGFTSTIRGGAGKHIPIRKRESHAVFLKDRLEQAWREAKSEFVVSHAVRQGVYLEFRGSPGYDLVTKGLEDMRSKKIRLCNIRIEKEATINDETGEFEDVTFATVFVSNDKRQDIFNKIENYATKESDKGKPKNADLINSIADIRKALLIESFWQDDHSLIPDEKPQWCEVWLRNDNPDVIQRFEKLIASQNIDSKFGCIIFPERAVKLVFVNNEQLANLTRLSDDIAEYRKAKDTTTFFWTEMPNREQAKWAEDIIDRLQVNRDSLVSVCILDTGVNNGHPLISPILDSADCQSYNPLWGSHDHDGHGTLMAGISGYGNLAEHLSGHGPIFINHMLESVKILPLKGGNKPELWGYITSQGVNLAEKRAPDRKRICCMAVTASDNRDRGKPSSWSGALDQITSGSGVDDGIKRLMVVSAGNITDFNQLSNYPDNQITDSLHDPAQSWNALTVGAYTQLTTITDPTLKGYMPIAQVNQLSPFSTTSLTWDNKWPIKPEIVMEGGNAAIDESGFVEHNADDLCLLSTNFQPQSRLFERFNMTSAAASQAAYFAAQIQIRYPDYWPETIRALVVHSAEWTDALKRQFAEDDSKTQLKNVLRACGYGVPNLERALYSAMNSLTLISQAEIQPYENRGGRKRTRDMHLYDLPWPREILRELREAEVDMRVTLSYFIEPGPGEIGWKDRYRYPSYALRFKINSPLETQEQFIKRINAEARDEDEGHPGTKSASKHWAIGESRDKGSIHSDIWKGTAAELAESHYIAVVPLIGWWRERAHLGKCESKARYSLIVTIKTPEQKVDIYTKQKVKVDIYTPVAQQVGVIIPVTIS